MDVPVPLSSKRRANEVIHDLRPKKTKDRYNEEYKKFCSWLERENVERGTVSDDIMLDYLSQLSKANKPTTMWSKFSMIKWNFNFFENVDFSSFSKSIAFLKQKSENYKPTKSKVFTTDQVSKFLIDAPDKEWLLSKVILTIGVFGACRKDDLLNLKFSDVKDNGNYFTVFLKDGKMPVHRSFTITDEESPYKPCVLIRKYMSLRPSSISSDRFFLGYRHGKCVFQNVGVHSIAAVPYKVAKYLGLENPEQFTGHALRRTSASMLVEGGSTLLTLKRHGGWKSSTVAEGYVDDSIERKIEVSKKLFAPVTASTSTAIFDSASTNESGATKRAEATSSKPKNQIVSAIKEEDVKEELILEDYGDPDEAMELQSVVGVQGTEDIRDAGVAFAPSFLPSGMEGSFETIICGSTDVKIKQEIFEDESDSFRSSHTAEITPISPPSMTFTESTELLSTVIPPAVLKTSSDSLKCLSKMTATPGYSAATKPTINVANMPGQPPHQWIRGDLNSGQNCACEICNAISRKIPVNSRKAARDKILELISFISDGSVNPALVNFSVMSK